MSFMRFKFKIILHKNILFFVFIFSSSSFISQTPIDVGPQTATFTSMVRGYHFTSPVTFNICGLYVPDDASSAPQSVRVVRFNTANPPAYPGTTNNFTQIFSQSNIAGNAMITCNIQVNAGDIIGVYGSRGANCVNSYSASNYVTNIGGQNVTLKRSGMQFCPAPGTPMHDIWSEVGGKIGRVIMYNNCCAQAPSISISSSNSNICIGQSTTIVASSSTPGGTFSWSNGMVGDTITVTPNSTTIYSASYNLPGCPLSSVSQTINVGQSSSQIIEHYLCPGSSVQIGSNVYSTQGVYYDTLVSSAGCDSIINSIVFINPEYSFNTDITICSGTSYSFNGIDYDTQGSYSETLQSVNGCDSIVNFNLFIEESSDTIINKTICTGYNYNFNGQSLFDSGQYVDTLLSVNGCDSVVVLSLFVTPAEVSLINETICDDSSYMFNNLSITSSGVYYDTLVSIAGCDSISSLYLNVVSCEFEISNILTPNNDGQNDTWMINDLSVISNCEVRVYNRWGQIVFESSDYQNDWDGTKSGELLPDGIYFYSIIGTGIEYTGSINLLRLKK